MWSNNHKALLQVKMKVKAKLSLLRYKNKRLRRTLNSYKIQILSSDFLLKYRTFSKLLFNGLFHLVTIVNGHLRNPSQVLLFLHSYLHWVKTFKQLSQMIYSESLLSFMSAFQQSFFWFILWYVGKKVGNLSNQLSTQFMHFYLLLLG